MAGYGVYLIRHLGSRHDANAVTFKAHGLSGNDFASFTRFNNAIDLHQPFANSNFCLGAALAPAFKLQQIAEFNMRVFTQ